MGQKVAFVGQVLVVVRPTRSKTDMYSKKVERKVRCSIC